MDWAVHPLIAVQYLLSARPVLGAGVPSVSQADPSLSAWLTSPARETSGKVITLLRVGRMSAHDQGLFRHLGQEGLSEEVTCRVVYVKFRRRVLKQGKQARARPQGGTGGHGGDQRGW